MKPYNPLEKENLGKSVADSLVSRTTVPLGKIERFHGAGVYASYYTGSFDAYAELGKWNCREDASLVPIYVRKGDSHRRQEGKR